MKKLLTKVMVFLIRVYQNSISPLSPGSCRFYPTCSAYAVEAIQVHGPLKGGFLAAKRIARCNPLFKGGYDPVPLPKEKRK